jgi:D-3-phosphoglycerate dehydrogenase
VNEKYRVRVLNNISAGGLRRLPWDRFVVSAEVDDPHAILVRSANMHGLEISESLLAVGRAGSGTNNIPIPDMSVRGIPVFNAPGANANAVKELVVTGMLLAARNIDHALTYLDSLDPEDPELENKIEAGKRRSTDMSWRIIRSASSASARSVVWLPMLRSSWA